MAPNGPADLVPRNLRALHGALEHSASLQATQLQGLMDELVGRGSLSRAEADDQLGRLASTGRAYSRALLRVLDTVTGQVSVRQEGSAGPEPSALPDLAELTVAEVRSRLAGLDATTLRRLRAQEAATRNRKGVLAAIDRRLG